MIGGYYVLELRCDTKSGCDRSEDFVYPTRMAAKDEARKAGWLLLRDNRSAVCPEHAELRRQQWRGRGAQ